jgi:hypothetical protein
MAVIIAVVRAVVIAVVIQRLSTGYPLVQGRSLRIAKPLNKIRSLSGFLADQLNI